jgi:acetolactate synthase I/II/III large subunit
MSEVKGPLLRSGGQILVDALIAHGVSKTFGVPGESYLPILDGIHQRHGQIEFVTCRHEGGAAFMADAYAKMTGLPGICLVTRGPGATNASIGVHTAFQDSTPMILLIGQVGRDMLEREAFQEIDYRRMFGQMAKWVAQIDDAARIPEFMARAFQMATSGRQGPVVLALPEDMLEDQVMVEDSPPFQRVPMSATPRQIEEVLHLLGNAKRPMIILGGSGWTRQSANDIVHFAEQNELPVACEFRCQDIVDNGHPNCVGEVGIGANPRLTDRIRNADVLLVLGSRLGEVTTNGYSLLRAPVPQQKLIHIYPDVNELGRVYAGALLICADAPSFAHAIKPEKLPSVVWKTSVKAAKDDYEGWQSRPVLLADEPGELDLWQMIRHLQNTLPADTILTNGAGNFTVWAHRFWKYGGLRTQLAPMSGAMGYGLPAAVAAKIADRGRTVVAIAGDGDFLMNGQELATAVEQRLGIIVIVFDNAMYGTIRMHQERRYPGRVAGTELENPDFAALARAYGAEGFYVQTNAQFVEALTQAVRFAAEESRPALIHLRTSRELLSPTTTVRMLRNARN